MGSHAGIVRRPQTPEQREVITLAHLAGLPRKEIAALFDRSEEAVRTQLHRAMARLAVLPEAADRNDS